MSNSASIEGYLHIDGFENLEQEVFNKRKVRAGMRKVGRLVAGRGQMNLALGGGSDGYPVNRTGTTVESINFKVSSGGFLVRVSPYKTSNMKEFYPTYLHYGVRMGSRIQPLPRYQGRRQRRSKGVRQKLVSARQQLGWRITPRDNYMTDALQDSRADVERILRETFSGALFS